MDVQDFYKKVKEKEELEKSEKEINEKLKNSFNFDGNYKKYGLLDYSWYKIYKDYLFDLINGKRNDIFYYDLKDFEVKIEKKIFCFIDNNYTFNFIINFQLVTTKFIELIL